MVIIAGTEKNVQENMKMINEELKKIIMAISEIEIKITVTLAEERLHNIKIEEKYIEQVTHFKYLDSMTERMANL